MFEPSDFLFTAATGYPLVDFTAAEWVPAVGRLADGPAAVPFSWDLELRLWSLVDALCGRSVGLVPYFAALVLLFAGGSWRGFRRPLVVAAATWLAALVILRPFAVAKVIRSC